MSNIKEFYNNNLEYWEQFQRASVREQYLSLLNLSEYAKHNEPLNVLDIGCGTGIDDKHISDIFEKLSFHSYKGLGLDFSNKSLVEARKRNNNKWEFLNLDIFKDDINQKFDVALCSMVIMHYPDLNQFFQRASSLLKNNGKLLLTTNNPYLVSYEYKIPYKNQTKYEHSFDTGDKKITSYKYLHTFESYLNNAKANHLTLETYKEIVSYDSDTGMFNNKSNNELEYPNFIAFVFRK